MAHIAADGSKWSNASKATARSLSVPGKSQGDGKQPVAASNFPKPEAPRAHTAEPVSASTGGESPSTADSSSDQSHAPSVEVTQDGNTFVVTAKFSSAEEAHAAAQAMSGGADDQQPAVANPAQAMM